MRTPVICGERDQYVANRTGESTNLTTGRGRVQWEIGDREMRVAKGHGGLEVKRLGALEDHEMRWVSGRPTWRANWCVFRRTQEALRGHHSCTGNEVGRADGGRLHGTVPVPHRRTRTCSMLDCGFAAIGWPPQVPFTVAGSLAIAVELPLPYRNFWFLRRGE